MEVAVTNVPIASREDILFLPITERGSFGDALSRGLHAPIVVLRPQAHVILEAVAFLDASWGDLLAQVPQLLELFHVLCNNTIDNAIFSDFEQLEHFLKVSV